MTAPPDPVSDPERLLRALLDQSVDGVFAFDREHRCIFWNATMERISGQPQRELLGRPIGGSFAFLSAIEAELRRALDGERFVVAARSFEVEQAARRVYELHYSPLLADGGAVVAAVAVVRDVTPKLEAEERLAESERRFEAMADSSPVLLWMSGEDSQCVFFNQSWLRFTGRTLAEELGVGWSDGVHAEDLQRCLDTYLVAFHARRDFEMEYRLRRADGEYRWILDRGSPRYHGDANFRGYIGSCVDITDRRAAEQSLLESELRLRLLLEHAADGIISLDGAGQISSLNPAALRLFGHPAAELLARPVAMLLGQADADGGDAGEWPALAAILRSSHEAVGRRRDGTLFPVELTLTETQLDDEQQWTLILRDVSERRAIQRLILEHREEVQMRIGQDLHDGLGQLLTGIAFMVKGLEPSVQPQSAQQVARLLDLINQAIAQVKALAKGLSPLHLEKRDLSSVLADLARDASSTAGVPCAFSDEGGDPAISVTDKTQLYMIAREAVTNAIKHAHASRIQISLSRAGDRCQMIIRDDGRGLPTVIPPSGFGVRSMQYRAQMLGGFLDISTIESGGTSVRCVWPIDSP